MNKQLKTRVLDALPEGRQLVPEEVDEVAEKTNADACTAVTYEGDSGAIAVSMLLLWYSYCETAVMCDRHREEWTIEMTDCPDLGAFEQAVRQTREMAEVEQRGHTKVVDEQGHERVLRDLETNDE
jgi:hypothetical protein